MSSMKYVCVKRVRYDQRLLAACLPGYELLYMSSA